MTVVFGTGSQSFCFDLIHSLTFTGLILDPSDFPSAPRVTVVSTFRRWEESVLTGVTFVTYVRVSRARVASGVPDPPGVSRVPTSEGQVRDNRDLHLNSIRGPISRFFPLILL